MTTTITAFTWVPAFAQGYVKDLRVRWALEEAGLPYDVELIDHETKTTASYRRRQPFGQVPAYRDDEVEMFESGAIVLHIAAKSPALAPADTAGKARVASWVFAALNSVEPFAQAVLQLEEHAAEASVATPRAAAQAQLHHRLAALAASLGTQDFFEHRFTAADLMICMVLRELVDCGALAPFPTLDAHRQRCEARPAFQTALAAQLRAFREHAPPVT